MTNNTNKTYIAIIGDIINSRKINNRNEVQHKLKQVLLEINDSFKDIISANFMITLGDEFQGLLCSQEFIFDIINYIEIHMFPTKIRFGIGVGEIDTDIIKDKSIEISGPAYYFARESISLLKQEKRGYKKVSSNIILKSGKEFTSQDELINTILSLIYISKSKWNEKAITVIKSYINNNHNQYNVAKELGVQQPAISKILTNNNYFTIDHSYKVLRKIMKERDEQ